MIRRLQICALLVACLSSFLHAKGERKNFQVYDFSKGVDTYHSSYTLPEGFVQDSLNLLFDEKAPASKRAGFTVAWSTKSYAYTGLWTYTDASNTTWQIARSSDQITASNLAGAVVLVATVSVNNLVGETNAFGNAYFVDQAQGVYYWNGSSTTIIYGSPKGSVIAQFHNRLWVTGAAVPNGNQLYGSAYYSGTSWTTGLNATDPVQYSVGLQDNFDNITALYVYLDTLYVFKHYAIYALYGFDQTNFQLSYLTQECGCIDGATIQTYNSGLKFVSLRGVEDFNGYTCKRISDPVKNMVDPVTQKALSLSSVQKAGSTAWIAGSFTPSLSLSTSSVSPNLTVSTYTKNYLTNTDFSGTLNNTQYMSPAGVGVSTTNTNVSNPGFESVPTLSDWSGDWTAGPDQGMYRISGSWSQNGCSLSAHAGSYFLSTWGDVHNGPTISIYDAVSSRLLVVNQPGLAIPGDCVWRQQTLTLGTEYVNHGINLVIYDPEYGKSIASEYFVYSGKPIKFWYANGQDINFPTYYRWAIDDFSDGVSTPTAGYYASGTYDTGLTNSVLFSSFTLSDYYDYPPTITMQTSSNGTTWSNLSPTFPVGTSMAGTFNTNRYVRFISSWTVLPNTGVPSISSANFVYVSSPSVFRSAVIGTSGLASYGTLAATTDLSKGGSITFSVCSSANSNMTPTVCVAQANNAQILVGTNTYTQILSSFTVSYATQTPTLQSLMMSWYTGNAPVPMASTVWDNRYWLALTTNTVNSANDTVLVLNKTGAWAALDIHAGAFTQYKNNLYHADSSGSGNIYLDNQGWSDNGAPITAYLVSKDVSLGSLASDDYLYAIYPSMAGGGACSVTFQYDMDHAGNYQSLGTPLMSEFITSTAGKLPFPVDSAHQDFGQSINFKVGTNDAQCGWDFFGLEGIYRQRPVQ